MAHIRKHARSPYWYLRHRDFESGEWTEKSTGLRVDSPEETRDAKRLADKATEEEQAIGDPNSSGLFASWVPRYLATHWQSRESDSPRRYKLAWRAIKTFLQINRIVYPRQVKYALGAAYIRWRMAAPVHGRSVGHNTALLELKFLSQLMTEAVRMGFAESNPIARLGIGRAPQKVKPELSDDEIAKLRAGLSKQPEWMRTAFEISLYTGCRFGECAFPLSNVDFARGTLKMRDSKRNEADPRKYFTVPLPPRLRPLLADLKERGELVTCKLSQDKNGRINRFFRACGVQASFHSLRVTFITRCHRGGLSEAEAMRLVNHSSQLVHRIYSRLNVEDVRAAQAKIPLP